MVGATWSGPHGCGLSSASISVSTAGSISWADSRGPPAPPSTSREGPSLRPVIAKAAEDVLPTRPADERTHAHAVVGLPGIPAENPEHLRRLAPGDGIDLEIEPPVTEAASPVQAAEELDDRQDGQSPAGQQGQAEQDRDLRPMVRDRRQGRSRGDRRRRWRTLGKVLEDLVAALR